MIEQKPVAYWITYESGAFALSFVKTNEKHINLFTAEQLKAEREKAIADNQHLINIGKLVLEKFVSGNSIPVSRCTISAEELALLSTNESKE